MHCPPDKIWQSLDTLWCPPPVKPEDIIHPQKSDTEITNYGETQACKSTGTQCHENPEQSRVQIRLELALCWDYLTLVLSHTSFSVSCELRILLTRPPHPPNTSFMVRADQEGDCLQPQPCWHSLEMAKELSNLLLPEGHLPPADLSPDLQKQTGNRSQHPGLIKGLQKSTMGKKHYSLFLNICTEIGPSLTKMFPKISYEAPTVLWAQEKSVKQSSALNGKAMVTKKVCFHEKNIYYRYWLQSPSLGI